MLFDDAEDRRETETGPFPDGFGGEERFEDLGAGLGVHADAGIADLERGVGAGLGPGMSLAEVVVHRSCSDGDGDAAAVGHGVSGVDTEIHQDLLELPGVGADDAGMAAPLELESDPFADDPIEELDGVAHLFTEIEELGLHHLSPAEGKQLPGQVCGAVRALADLGQVDRDFVVGGRAPSRRGRCGPASPAGCC